MGISEIQSFLLSIHKRKTLDQFINSKLYADFIRFGTYLKNNPPIYPEQYIEFLLIGQVDITKWALPYIYDAYLRELNKKTPMAAMERTVVLMSEWEMTIIVIKLVSLRKYRPIKLNIMVANR